MIPFQVNDKTYLVQFRYRTRRGKHAGLYGGAKINGVTVCVISGTRPDGPFVAIGTSICTEEDRFVLRQGRRYAFENAVKACGLLKEDGPALLAIFSERFPEPVAKPPRAKPPKLTPEEKAVRAYEGRQKRDLRQIARSGSAGGAQHG